MRLFQQDDKDEIVKDYTRHIIPEPSMEFKIHSEVSIIKSNDSLTYLNRVFSYFWILISTYFYLGFIIIVGHIKDLFLLLRSKKKVEKGYCAILTGFKYFFYTRIYTPVQDLFNRPICSCPGAKFTLMDRIHKKGKLVLSGTTSECINLSSYNYLGFADPESPCQEPVLDSLSRYSVSSCTNRSAVENDLLVTLEKKIAQLTGKPRAAVFSMGFGCNSTFIPFFLRKGDLILSDEKNHSSMINGFLASDASVKVFKHNDMKDLEKQIKKAIVQGQPGILKPWNRLFIFIEGLYSMEGYYPKLKQIVKLKKKYKCYLYLDEAHSFGALGKHGLGVCEQLSVDTKDIDILMGTFTKSFGAFGGFIASTKAVINEIKESCAGFIHSPSIPPVLCQQILSALKVIEAENYARVRKLHSNANYFRRRLIDEGFSVFGDEDSPVAVVVVGSISLVVMLSRECLRKKIAVVVAGFPATKLTGSRVRFCISSAHTKSDLDKTLKAIIEVLGIIRC